MREAIKDRISKLPDALLHRIQHYLPIKDGARTSALSRRWNYIWSTVPTLDLRIYVSSSSETEKFMDFVDGTLRRRHNSSNVYKFFLRWDHHLNESRLHSWIATVIRGKVKKLSLFLPQELPSSVSPSLFTCESLTSLELFVRPNICLPRYVSLPRLKRLALTEFEFSNECWNEQLFSNSPVLEELILTYCTVSMKNFCISIPTLTLLEVHLPDEDADCFVSKIYAPRLATLYYWGCVGKEFVFSSSPALVEAAVYFIFEENDGAAKVRCLRALAHVKRLTVYHQTVQSLTKSLRKMLCSLSFSCEIRRCSH